MILSNRKTPTSSGSGPPYPASVTIVSSTIVSSDDSLRWRVSPKRTALNECYRAEDEYRRSRNPQRNTYRRRIEYRRTAFPNRPLGGEGGRVHPTARKYSSVALRLRRKSRCSALAERVHSLITLISPDRFTNKYPSSFKNGKI